MDDCTKIAISMQANKGVYALLLGSGISISAGIPTAWTITEDLVFKLAAALGENIVGNWDEWYRVKYNEEPSYSLILSKLVETSSERVNLMLPYFEPNRDESEAEIKQPTEAHKAIAKLAKKGYIKMVITTNFDRLLEIALESEGVVPQIIRCKEDLDHAIPIPHAPFTILKLNGDYKDCQFRNTDIELSSYPIEILNYLHRIISDFGLITCGWSADWDKALTDTIKLVANRRYSAYYTHINQPSRGLNDLVRLTKESRLVLIENADTFFSNLYEKVSAIEDANEKVLDKNILVAQVKRYLSKPEYRIKLYDLFELLTNQAKNSTTIYTNQTFNVGLFNDAFRDSTQNLSLLINASITLVRWVDVKDENILVDTFKSLLANIYPDVVGSYSDKTYKLNRISILIYFFSIAIACVVYEKYSILHKLLQIKILNRRREREYWFTWCNTYIYDSRDVNHWIGKNFYFPFSEYLRGSISLFFEGLKDFADYYVIVEYLFALNYYHCVEYLGEKWCPMGTYSYLMRGGDYQASKLYELKIEIDNLKDKHPLIKAGLFDNDYTKYLEVSQVVLEKIQQRAWLG